MALKPGNISFLQAIIYSFLIVSFSLLAYWNSLENDFVFDDVTIVKENRLIKDLRNIPEIFSTDYWAMGSAYQTGLYRPLTILSFALNYYYSEDNPIPYHLTNLIIHSINSILIFFFFFLIFKNTKGALLCSLIFAVHPIHTEAVTGIVGRAELLSFLFFFTSLVTFLLACSLSKTRTFILYLISLMAFLLALLSKEIAASLLLVVFFLLIFLDRRVEGRKLFHSLIKHKWKLVAFLLIFGFYLLLRIIIFGSPMGTSKPISLDNPLAHVSYIERILGASAIQLKYLYLLIYPMHLSADYSYNQIPLHGILPYMIGGIALAIVLILFALLFFLYLKGSEFFVPLSFYLASIFLVSNFLITIGTIMAERLLYLPSAALCILLGILLSPDGGYFLKGKNRYKYFYLLLAILVAFGMVRTFYRNTDWKDEKILFLKTTETSPMSAKIHNNLGNLLLKEGQLINAEREFNIALSIHPEYSTAVCNLGTILERKGFIDDAIEKYQKAIELDPEFDLAYFNLGNAFHKRGDFKKALTAYRQAISIYPDYAEAYYNLGNSFALKNLLEAAAYHYQRALEIEPNYVEAENNLGLVFGAIGKRKEAEMAFQKAIKISPSYHGALFNLGKLYAQEEKYQKAIPLLEKARKENADHFGTLFYLGICYLKIGEPKKAYVALKKAEDLEPDNKDLKLVLGLFKRKK